MLSMLFNRVKSDSIVYFRIMFGLFLFYEMLHYYSMGWVKSLWVDPPFHFSFYGFEWVQALPGNGIYWVAGVVAVAALFVALGFLYRISSVLLFLGFTYLFLLDEAYYLNHFYLISLLCFLMCFIPAHRSFSVDSYLFPKIRDNTVPLWSVWLLQFQIGIVYFYGGIAKINPDWLAGEPLRTWLGEQTDFPLLGAHFDKEWVVYFFSYTGLFLDLLIVPVLMYRPTRWLGVISLAVFHGMNSQLFHIGIFPWFMLCATPLFFEPEWFANLAKRLGITGRKEEKQLPVPGPVSKPMTIFLLTWVAIQLLLPFRYIMYPGNVSWTEEGHYFSWHMKLRDKKATSIKYFAYNPETDKKYSIDPLYYITKFQLTKASLKPHLTLQLCRHIANELEKMGKGRMEIRAMIWVTFNGREPQLIIDPTVNLAEKQRSLKHQSWINPLQE